MSILFFMILLGAVLLPVVEAKACYVTSSSTCRSNGDTRIMYLSGPFLGGAYTTNLHGEYWSGGATLAVLCCDFPGDQGEDACGTNDVSKLLSIESAAQPEQALNSHVQRIEEQEEGDYGTNICFEGFVSGDGSSPSCFTTAGACTGEPTELEVIRISGHTNAHIEKPGGTNYQYAVCCHVAVCGDFVIEGGEECDDGNTADGDGCDSECQDETGCTDTCSSEGYECGTHVICGEPISCGPDTRSCIKNYGTCSETGTQTCVSGSYGSCEGTTDPTIANCAGKECGSDGCGGSCGTCSGEQVCVEGSCIIEEGCNLRNATWNETRVLAGTGVKLIVNGTADCDGQIVSFEVKEYDSLGSDKSVEEGPPEVIFDGDTAIGTWTAEYQEDNEGNPEYYFEATSEGENLESGKGDEDLLEVLPSYLCIGINYCKDYDNEDDCNADNCKVWENSSHEYLDEECGDCVAGMMYIGCECKWDDSEGECVFANGVEDCSGGLSDGTSIGNCTYNTEEVNDCDTPPVGFYIHSWNGTWTWGNEYPTPADCEDVHEAGNCIQDGGNWHYDPEDKKGVCEEGGENQLECPEEILLPFFGFYNFVIALALVFIFYFVAYLRRK